MGYTNAITLENYFETRLGQSMAKKIGIFMQEQQVVDAIGQLEQSGLKPGQMMVLAKDAYHTRALEAETDVHADAILEIEQANETDDHNEGDFRTAMHNGLPGAVYAPLYGLHSYGGSTNAGIPFLSPFTDEGNGHRSAFMGLGLDSKETELASSEVMSGAWALVVETSESKALLDKDGGPDLSVLGIAEGVFRRCGASRIVDGS